jgi:uncharacterized protein (DUF983 family)
LLTVNPKPPPPPPRAVSRAGKRTTDTELRAPSLANARILLPRLLRLRCPNCGKGPVMNWRGSILPRCPVCNFRFERSDENYFAGAMFFGLLFGEFLFAISLLIIILSMWPNVPWDTMTWAIPLGMVVVLIFWIPISRVVWLTIDVLVRPVQPHELEG